MIQFSECDGHYYIWNVEGTDRKFLNCSELCYTLFNLLDITKLRKEFRILGELVGSPGGNKVNITNLNLMGLPLRLSQFEAKLGIEKGGEFFTFLLCYLSHSARLPRMHK